LDPQHFRDYPHSIEYVYNSRGFRDAEWPQDLATLRQAIWCVGDSFTVGVGQPFDHIWPQVLARALARRTINVSMDGASNAWIHRRAWDIISEVRPRCMVVMWSYTHRTESTDPDLSDEDRRIHVSHNTSEQDYQQWLSWVQGLDQAPCEVIQCTVPKFCDSRPVTPRAIQELWQRIADPSWPMPQDLQQLLDLDPGVRRELQDDFGCWQVFWDYFQGAAGSKLIHVDPQLDLARDGHHFDVLTSQWVVQQIHMKLQQKDASVDDPVQHDDLIPHD
jgi:hypothetical protein